MWVYKIIGKYGVTKKLLSWFKRRWNWRFHTYWSYSYSCLRMYDITGTNLLVFWVFLVEVSFAIYSVTQDRNISYCSVGCYRKYRKFSEQRHRTSSVKTYRTCSISIHRKGSEPSDRTSSVSVSRNFTKYSVTSYRIYAIFSVGFNRKCVIEHHFFQRCIFLNKVCIQQITSF